MCNGGWNARRNGRDLKRDKSRKYIEETDGDTFITSAVEHKAVINSARASGIGTYHG
ncbi:MAG: hypothetical protein IJP86_05440 [Synergistaceae bacterium]|nr:hypothetical protein [Synergistaceae bacterium]